MNVGVDCLDEGFGDFLGMMERGPVSTYKTWIGTMVGELNQYQVRYSLMVGTERKLV